MTFFHDLWESVFTPGPTPSLLVAANATFGCLQALLLLLLAVAPYKVHVATLSLLCAGLCCAINWFAAELQNAQLCQGIGQSQPSAAAISTAAASTASRHSAVPTTATAQSDTEVEPDTSLQPVSSSVAAVKPTPGGDFRLRGVAAAEPATRAGTRSSVSIEDEWEKVSESEKDK